MASGKPSRFSTSDFVRAYSFCRASSLRLTWVPSSLITSSVLLMASILLCRASSSALSLSICCCFSLLISLISCSLLSNSSRLADCSVESDAALSSSCFRVESWICLISRSLVSWYTSSRLSLKLRLRILTSSCKAAVSVFWWSYSPFSRSSLAATSESILSATCFSLVRLSIEKDRTKGQRDYTGRNTKKSEWMKKTEYQEYVAQFSKTIIRPPSNLKS